MATRDETPEPAEISPEISAELLVRLDAVGGLLTGHRDKRFGSIEVLTPYGAPYTFVWTTPAGLEALVRDWEAMPGIGPRPLAFWLLKDAQE